MTALRKQSACKGKGLERGELKINIFLGGSKILDRKSKEDVRVPVEFANHASTSRLFAFWLQIGILRQDRPFYFYLGIIFVCYAAANVIKTIGMKVWSTLT